MISRRIFAAVALLCAFSFPANAQPFTKAQLNGQVGANFPDNNTFQITPQNVRTITDNIVNSIMPTAPVVSGNLACFSGTTGLLQDCGVAPSNNIVLNVTPITGGSVNTRVLYDNSGTVGEYTNTQLTALINAATSSLSGALPAWPNNTSTALLGNGTYGPINLATGVSGLLPNANLAQAGAASFKGNPTASTAAVQDFTIQGLVSRGAPDAVNDKIPLFDAAAGSIKYVTPGAIASSATSGVSSINAGTGAFTTSNGVITSGTVIQTDFTHNNVWTGSNNFRGNDFFGSGQHWVDVKSGANGCAAAVGDNTNPDRAAIQCQITYMNVNFGGGTVFFSPGTYLIDTSALIVPSGIYLVGPSQAAATLNTKTDTPVVLFATGSGTCVASSGNHGGGMDRISVNGYTTSPTTDAVTIGAKCNVYISNAQILYGRNGLLNNGVDSRLYNVFVWGYTAAIHSGGANHYIGVKADQPAGTGSTYGFYQDVAISGLTKAENSFVDCDFSGTYTFSIFINDTTSTSAITEFTNTDFSSPVSVPNAVWTSFNGIKFGTNSVSVNSGFLNITNSYGFVPITVTGGATRVCAANSQVTC